MAFVHSGFCLNREFCGYPEKRWVIRSGYSDTGDFVGQYPTEQEALAGIGRLTETDPSTLRRQKQRPQTFSEFLGRS